MHKGRGKIMKKTAFLALLFIPFSVMADNNLRYLFDLKGNNISVFIEPTIFGGSKNIEECSPENNSRVTLKEVSKNGNIRFANVEILDGSCSGLSGWVAWNTISMTPFGR